LKKEKKSKILFVLQLPPPVHGSSVVGEYMKESHLITSVFISEFVNSSLSRQMDKIDKMSFSKVVIYGSILIQVLRRLLVFKPQLCYLAITAKGFAFYKDVLIVLLFKLFRKKIILHFHNKGVCQYQDRWLDDKLYRFIFKNSKVILLSKQLYFDIRKYVNEKDVFICPNGISN
jgi:hypothetical protein